MKKVLSALLFTGILATSASAVDFSIRLNPNVIVPLQEYYSPAIGGLAQFDVQLFDLITAGIEGGVSYESPENTNSGITLISGGIGAGAYYTLFSRMYLGAGAAGGLATYSFKADNVDYNLTNFYFRGYGEVGFIINPTFTVSGNVGYTHYMAPGDTAILSGLSAGISARINFSAGKGSKSDCYANVRQEADIYPLFQQVYRTSPFATATIVNGESAEIRNVTVSFRGGKYTSSALKSEVIPVIRKMKSYEVPLLVDFSSDLLRFSENGKLSGEIVIEYELLGKKKTSVQSATFSVSNRNSYIWGNNESIAAFISPDTPEILEYAKYVVGVARNDLYTGMNRNIQFAASLFESLRISGLTYSGDKNTPYVQYHTTSNTDYIQYPLQTMDFSSGDYDELGILFASCLESVGVETAFMPLNDDFLVFVALDVSPRTAENHFESVDKLVVTDDNVYFALSMAEFTNGFAKSRAKGAELVKKCNEDENGEYEFISTHNAWQIYPAAVYTGSGEPLAQPSQAEIQKVTKAAVLDYMNTDISKVIERARASGDSNKLGVAYIRAGRYSDAKAEFSKGANAGNISSINNLANVYVIEKNYTAASAQYKKVLQIDPANKTALKGLENVSSKIAE